MITSTTNNNNEAKNKDKGDIMAQTHFVLNVTASGVGAFSVFTDTDFKF